MPTGTPSAVAITMLPIFSSRMRASTSPVDGVLRAADRAAPQQVLERSRHAVRVEGGLAGVVAHLGLCAREQ
jgi:hypothetical protein